MYIKEIEEKKRKIFNFNVDFATIIIISLLFLLEALFLNKIYLYITTSIFLGFILIGIIINYFLFNKNYTYKSYIFEVISGLIFFTGYEYISFISSNYYNPFIIILLLLVIKTIFFEDNLYNTYIYFLYYEILSIIIFFKTNSINLELYLSIGIILSFVLILYIKNRIYLTQKNIEDISQENTYYKNKRESNMNFIDNILLDIKKYLSNIDSRDEYKDNVFVLSRIEKKVQDRIAIQNEKYDLQVSVFKIDKILNSILHIYYPIIKSKGLEIVFNKFTNQDYYINSDEQKIAEILTEIIENAINFSPENSKIEITEEKKDNRLIIFVKNYSNNIIDESKIYNLNYSYGENSSLGIGLYIAKVYTKIIQGRVSVFQGNPSEVISKIELPFITYT
jgi:signal transduction histidine kinase